MRYSFEVRFGKSPSLKVFWLKLLSRPKKRRSVELRVHTIVRPKLNDWFRNKLELTRSIHPLCWWSRVKRWCWTWPRWWWWWETIEQVFITKFNPDVTSHDTGLESKRCVHRVMTALKVSTVCIVLWLWLSVSICDRDVTRDLQDRPYCWQYSTYSKDLFDRVQSLSESLLSLSPKNFKHVLKLSKLSNLPRLERLNSVGWNRIEVS